MNKIIKNIAKTLVIVGALNWGLVGVFGFNLVTFVTGFIQFIPMIDKIVYGAVGVSAIIEVYEIATKK